MASAKKKQVYYRMTISNLKIGLTVSKVMGEMQKTFGYHDDFQDEIDLVGTEKIDASRIYETTVTEATHESILQQQGRGKVVLVAKKTLKLVCFVTVLNCFGV